VVPLHAFWKNRLCKKRVRIGEPVRGFMLLLLHYTLGYRRGMQKN